MRSPLKILWIGTVAWWGMSVPGAIADPEAKQLSIPGVIAEAQYRPSITGVTYPLLEVYLTNHSDKTIEWKRAFLDGVEVKGMANGCVWIQFYPTHKTAPGETTELQICVEDRPAQPQSVEIEDAEGRRCAVEFTSFIHPEVHLTGLTFSEGLRKAYVTYKTQNLDPTLLNVSVNGRDVTKETQLMEIPTRKYPALLVIPLPEPMREGQIFYLRLEFEDEMVVHAMVRASWGIMLDDSGVKEDDLALRKELGLDRHPIARLIDSDPAGYEHDGNKPGKGAAKTMEKREAWYTEAPKYLAYENLGKFAGPAGYYAVYAQMVDAISISPERLAFSDAPRFIEDEEKAFSPLKVAAEPRPIYWTHKVRKFTWRDRMLEPGEFRLLAWAALANGVKGINHFTYNGAPPDLGYSRSPALLAEIQKFNREVKGLEPYLSPAIPVWNESDISLKEGVRVYTLWSGDKGQLVIVRDLKYETDHLANEAGANPRFHYSPMGPLTVSVPKPGWLSPIIKNEKPEVIDLLSQEAMDASIDGHSIQIALPGLDLVRLLWIPNGPHRESTTASKKEPGEDPALTKPRILKAEDTNRHLEASMQLLTDPVDHGVYAILLSLKNTSRTEEFLFTEEKGSAHGFFVQVLRSGEYLSNDTFAIRCFVTEPPAKVVKIPPLETHEWLLPVADLLKEKLSAQQVLKNCYISMAIMFLNEPPKPRLLGLDEPQVPPDNRQQFISLHESNATLTGKALEGDAKEKFEKYGNPDAAIK